MDHYNEQLVQKASEPKDIALRAVILIATVIVTVFALLMAFMTGFFLLTVIAVGAVYLAYWLFTNTFVEYEYIVTNNDMDIDKVLGRKKRKRLISIQLSTVSDWGEYAAKKSDESKINATVMASDATGIDAWYLIFDHGSHGKTMLIFTPNEETIQNINHAVAYSIRKKLAKPEKEPPEETQE